MYNTVDDFKTKRFFTMSSSFMEDNTADMLNANEIILHKTREEALNNARIDMQDHIAYGDIDYERCVFVFEVVGVVKLPPVEVLEEQLKKIVVKDSRVVPLQLAA